MENVNPKTATDLKNEGRLKTQLEMLTAAPAHAAKVIGDIERGAALLTEMVAQKKQSAEVTLAKWQTSATAWREKAAAALADDDTAAINALVETMPSLSPINSFMVFDTEDENLELDLGELIG